MKKVLIIHPTNSNVVYLVEAILKNGDDYDFAGKDDALLILNENHPNLIIFLALFGIKKELSREEEINLFNVIKQSIQSDQKLYVVANENLRIPFGSYQNFWKIPLSKEKVNKIQRKITKALGD